MSTLLVLIPPRPRGDVSAAVGATTEFAWVLTQEGAGVDAQGRAPSALLPRADAVVAVLSTADLGWQPLEVPRVPATRLREALAGVLEESLLEEPQGLHFALEPGAAPGRRAWVAVVHRAWLTQALAALEQGGVAVDRIVPAWAPGAPWRAHVSEIEEGVGGSGGLADGATSARVCVAGPQGVAELPLEGPWARRLIEAAGQDPVLWTAAPACVAAAERWVERSWSRPAGADAPLSAPPPPVAVLGPAEVALRAAASAWDLRQFDLALPRRGSRWLVQAWRTLRTAPWKPVRVGLALLLGLQVVGLNAWAWQQEQRLKRLRLEQVALLQSAHPQVRAVLDAPLQMQRETERLRAAAGQPGEADLEGALAAAAGAWPAGLGPARALRFEAGRLTLSVSGWSAAQVQAFGERLQPTGWQVEFAADRLVLTRASARRPMGPRS